MNRVCSSSMRFLSSTAKKFYQNIKGDHGFVAFMFGKKKVAICGISGLATTGAIFFLKNRHNSNKEAKALLDRLAVGCFPVIKEGRQQVMGSGAVYDNEGHIVTCAHVAKESDNMWVTYDGKQIMATKIAEDTVHDIAVLKIDPKGISGNVTFSDLCKRQKKKQNHTKYFSEQFFKRWDLENTSSKIAKIASIECDKCLVSEEESDYSYCLGYVTARAGASGSPVISSRGSEQRLLGLYDFAASRPKFRLSLNAPIYFEYDKSAIHIYGRAISCEVVTNFVDKAIRSK